MAIIPNVNPTKKQILIVKRGGGRKKKPGIVVLAVGAGESGVRGQHPLDSEFKVSLDMIPCSQATKQERKNKNTCHKIHHVNSF